MCDVHVCYEKTIAICHHDVYMSCMFLVVYKIQPYQFECDVIQVIENISKNVETNLIFLSFVFVHNNSNYHLFATNVLSHC